MISLMTDNVSASDWTKGIILSVVASMIGGASKLAIRKSWLLEEFQRQQQQQLLLLQQPVLQDAEAEGGSLQGVDLPDADDSLASPTSDVSPISSSFHLDLTSSPLPPATEEESSNLLDLDASSHSSSLTTASNDSKDWLPLAFRGFGMVGMTLLNPLCSVLAMNYASPSILAPFSGLTLVWIVLFSNPLIGEQPTLVQVMAAGLIIFGELVVGLFGDHTNDDGVTVEDVRDSYMRAPFLIYLGVLALWMLLLFHWMRNGSPTLKRFAWGVSGGSITGLQNFLKDALTLMKATNGHEATSSSLPWYSLLLWTLAIVAAFSGLLMLTACMKRYDATYSSAMFVGSFVVSASLMSVVHYNTFHHLETTRSKLLYPTGLLILMAGVYSLVQATKGAPQDEDDENYNASGVGVHSDSTAPKQQRRVSSDSDSDLREPLVHNEHRVV